MFMATVIDAQGTNLFCVRNDGPMLSDEAPVGQSSEK
jgi:hypothetical protein